MAALIRRCKLQRVPHKGIAGHKRGRAELAGTVAGDMRHIRHARRTPLAELTGGIVQRAFRGDAEIYRRFLATLREPIGDADIVLRGSAVTGESYRGHEAFDAHGFGSSDLDLVLLGPDAFRHWKPTAAYVRGVNTIPLSDKSAWVAPDLDPARRAAQELVDRPVNIQAMARWFLELRAIVQGQQHVTLMEQV